MVSGMSEKESTQKSRRGGKRDGAGRPKGVPNKLSGTAKEHIAQVFEKLGGVEQMTTWAQENQTPFYNLYAKLLPLQVSGEGGGPLIHKIVREIVRTTD